LRGGQGPPHRTLMGQGVKRPIFLEFKTDFAASKNPQDRCGQAGLYRLPGALLNPLARPVLVPRVSP
jgi:hypothetical protein